MSRSFLLVYCIISLCILGCVSPVEPPEWSWIVSVGPNGGPVMGKSDCGQPNLLLMKYPVEKMIESKSLNLEPETKQQAHNFIEALKIDRKNYLKNCEQLEFIRSNQLYGISQFDTTSDYYKQQFKEIQEEYENDKHILDSTYEGWSSANCYIFTIGLIKADIRSKGDSLTRAKKIFWWEWYLTYDEKPWREFEE